MKLISGIWLLDVINLLKYKGVDIFDSVVKVDASIWWIVIGGIFAINLITGLTKELSKKKK